MGAGYTLVWFRASLKGRPLYAAGFRDRAPLLRRGIAVSLHSDDPPYFGGYISHCFEQTAAALDLSPAEVIELNRNAIRAAFLDDETKQRFLAASEVIFEAGRLR
jgi:hypothetical protein